MKFKKGILYSLKNVLWGDNIYKIGNTGQNINKRISNMQTSLYINCELEYITTNLVCCKYYEFLLKNILSSYKVNPRREFYFITKEEIKLIFDFFIELNNQLDNPEKLLKYIQENNPEYLNKKRKYVKSESLSDNSNNINKIKRLNDKPKRKKKRGLFIDTSY